jgi:dTMP kinase
MSKGILIVFEGIDGAGKTTQAQLLYDELQRRGTDVLLTKEPTDSACGQRIKALAKDERNMVSPDYEYKLFLEDRKLHVRDLIEPALARKRIIIMDRYYYSNIAYQGALGLDTKAIKIDNEAFAPVPDLVIILDLPIEAGLQRIVRNRNEQPNLFEKEENLKKVKALFDQMRENHITHLNGSMEVETLHSTIMGLVEQVLSNDSVHNSRDPLTTAK